MTERRLEKNPEPALICFGMLGGFRASLFSFVMIIGFLITGLKD